MSKIDLVKCEKCGGTTDYSAVIDGQVLCAECEYEVRAKKFLANPLKKHFKTKDQQIFDLEAKLAESEKEKDYYQDLYFTSVKGQEKLKQQLAEKEKELAYITKQAKKFNNEAQKYFEDAYCNDTIYQDKISFAVEQLEKVKENILLDISIGIQREWISNKIDNQIKQLKEMNNG